MSGGAGYVMSREALRRVVREGLPYYDKCEMLDYGVEDVELGRCLESVGVVAGDSRDRLGRHRMLPFPPTEHFLPENKPNSTQPSWFYKMMYVLYWRWGRLPTTALVFQILSIHAGELSWCFPRPIHINSLV